MALGGVRCRDLFLWAPMVSADAARELRVATFRCDITPPLGQPMFKCDPLQTVEQPLLAKGIVLEAAADDTCSAPWIGASCATGRTIRCRK